MYHLENPPACSIGNKSKCRFMPLVGERTTGLDSPLQFDLTGKIVGGGKNTVIKVVACHACNTKWTSSQTEFDDAVGKPRQWTDCGTA